MRQQMIDFTSELHRQAREGIFKIRVRIMPVEPRGLDQSHDRCRPFYTARTFGHEITLDDHPGMQHIHRRYGFFLPDS